MATVERYVLRDGSKDRRTFLQRAGDAWTAAKRALHLGPYNLKDPALVSLFGGGPVAAGVSVNDTSALGLAAVWCAVTTIAGDIAALPLKLYRRTANGRELYGAHPLYRLIHDQANPEMTSFVWRQVMMVQALLTGNAYAEIERSVDGRAIALWPIASDRVAIDRTAGVLRYRVSNEGRGDVYLPAGDMIHFRGPGLLGELGADVVTLLRQVFGLSIATEQFAATFFSNASVLGGTIQATNALTPQAKKNLRESIEARHQGSDRAHGLMILDGGLAYTPLTPNLQQSQFTELRTHQVREVARVFKMPPSKLGDLADATFSNVEQENLHYLQQTLTPWLRMIESELTAKLIAVSERNLQTIEFSVDGLLRADVEKRGAFYGQMVSHGLMTPNEIRQLENLPTMPGGDALRVPSNTAPLGADSQ